MATDIRQADRLKLRAYCHLSEQASVTTFYYAVNNIVAGIWTDERVLASWAAIASAAFKLEISVAATYDGSSIQIVTQKPFSGVVYDATGQGLGTAAGNPMPTQVRGMISRRTNLSGRGYRGRIYMPFPSVLQMGTDGLPSAAYRSALAALIDDLEPPAGLTLTAGADSIFLVPILVHKNPALAAASITGHIFPSKFGTQRRSGSYGKANFSPPMTNPS